MPLDLLTYTPIELTKETIIRAQNTIKHSTLPHIILWDVRIRGFGVKITKPSLKYPFGKAAYLVQKRMGGAKSKEIRYVFAQYPDIDLVQARNQALTLISQIRQGVDISAKRQELFKLRETQLIQYKTTQFKALIEDFAQQRAKATLQSKGKPSRYWEQEVSSLLKMWVYPTIPASTPLNHIDKDTLRALLKGISSPHLGLKVYSTLKTFFEHAMHENIISHNPMHALKSPHDKPLSRDRVLNTNELRAYLRACDTLTESNYYRTQMFGYCFKLVLLTGTRRDEVAELPLCELNLDAALWEIPVVRAKNDCAHLIHLPKLALDTIKAVQALNKHHNCKYLFSANGRTPISGFSDAKKHLDRLVQANLPIGEPLKPFHLHDTRSTLATICAGILKINENVCDRHLNHVTKRTRSNVKLTYQKYDYFDERKELMERWCAYLEGLASS